eukprot:5086743-Prymnesium_polylepis.1
MLGRVSAAPARERGMRERSGAKILASRATLAPCSPQPAAIPPSSRTHARSRRRVLARTARRRCSTRRRRPWPRCAPRIVRPG